MSKRGNQKYGDNKRLCLLHCELLLGFFSLVAVVRFKLFPLKLEYFCLSMNCISKRWWEMLYDVAKFLPNKYSFVFIDFPLMTSVQHIASQTKTSDIALTVLVYSIDEYNPGKTPFRISLAYGYMGSLFSGTAVPNS